MAADLIDACVTLDLPGATDRAFQAWLDPVAIARWMFGPDVRNEELIRLSIDPVVGGRFSFVVHRGGTEIDHLGEYRVIDPPARLEFTWQVAGTPGAPSLVLVELTKLSDSRCRCQLIHRLPVAWADFVPKIEASWTLMLTKQAEFLAKSSINS